MHASVRERAYRPSLLSIHLGTPARHVALPTWSIGSPRGTRPRVSPWRESAMALSRLVIFATLCLRHLLFSPPLSLGSYSSASRGGHPEGIRFCIRRQSSLYLPERSGRSTAVCASIRPRALLPTLLSSILISIFRSGRRWSVASPGAYLPSYNLSGDLLLVLRVPSPPSSPLLSCPLPRLSHSICRNPIINMGYIPRASIMTTPPFPWRASMAPPGSSEPGEGLSSTPPAPAGRSLDMVTPSSPPRAFQKTRFSRHSTISTEVGTSVFEQIAGSPSVAAASPDDLTVVPVRAAPLSAAFAVPCGRPAMGTSRSHPPPWRSPWGVAFPPGKAITQFRVALARPNCSAWTSIDPRLFL